MRRWSFLLLLCVAMVVPDLARASESVLGTSRFGSVAIYAPERDAVSVALFMSGDGGWNRGVVGMARALAEQGALVIGIDIRRYLDEASASGCRSMAVDFENLSHEVQKQLRLAEYHPPILVGYSSGATLAYATLAQAPVGTFAGAVSLGFCPDLELRQPPCRGDGLTYTAAKRGAYLLDARAELPQKWFALQGQQDRVCSPQVTGEFAARTGNAEVVRLPHVGHGFSVERNWLPQFRTSYASLESLVKPTAASVEIADLPLTEVTTTRAGDQLALMLSGDGGWAGLDQAVAKRLADRGVPVIGFNTLKYFWQAREPAGAAEDVARALRYYLDAWGRNKVLLIGYSFGADVLPFIVNRLPADLQARIVSTSLLGPATHATFEVHVADWIPGTQKTGVPIAPELEHLTTDRVLCIYGNGEADSLCGPAGAHGVTVAEIGNGHHFSGAYDQLSDRILQFAGDSARRRNT